MAVTKIAKKPYRDYSADELEDEGMDSGLRDTIIIERREEVGRVLLGDGPGSAITEAFRISGEYISDHLRDGSDNNITIEFAWNGCNFIAKVES